MSEEDVPGFMAKAQMHIDQLTATNGPVRYWTIVFYLVAAVVEALLLIARQLNEIRKDHE